MLTQPPQQNIHEQLDSATDRGEAALPPEAPVTEAEVEARHKELIDRNTELVAALFSTATSSGLLSEAQIDRFVLPNRSTNVRELRRQLDETNDKLNANALAETEEEQVVLRETKAALVTELLYALTALVGEQLPKRLATIATQVESDKATGSQEGAQQLDQLKKLCPQWEALLTNSRQTLLFLRDKYASVVSDKYLGELNASLYLQLNLDTSDLPAQELRQTNGGTLIDKMGDIETTLQKIVSMPDAQAVETVASNIPEVAAELPQQQIEQPADQSEELPEEIEPTESI